jgi:LmbE family N-acetylglucosaminyl deacetylase
MPPAFSQPRSRIYVPSGQDVSAALARATHLCVAAHPDDAEFMALAGILEAKPSQGFACVVLADGASGPDARPGLAEERAAEACAAAQVGGYAALILLGHSSAQVKDGRQPGLGQDLDLILQLCRPQKAYLHQPFDRHPTHQAACLRALEALRRLGPGQRPRQVIGCEVWGSLDWVPAPWRMAQPLHGHIELARALAACFPSQLKDKAYGSALLGRLQANATFDQSHAPDKAAGLSLGIDLTPLLDRGIQSGMQDLIKAFGSEAVKSMGGFTV